MQPFWAALSSQDRLSTASELTISSQFHYSGSIFREKSSQYFGHVVCTLFRCEIGNFSIWAIHITDRKILWSVDLRLSFALIFSLLEFWPQSTYFMARKKLCRFVSSSVSPLSANFFLIFAATDIISRALHCIDLCLLAVFFAASFL